VSVDLIECALLAPRVGEVFAAEVIEVAKGIAQVQLCDHPVLTRLRVPRDASIQPGTELALRLVGVDLDRARLDLEPVEPLAP
jgi:hypothetical protein